MQDLEVFITQLQNALDLQQFEGVLQALAVDAVNRAGNAALTGEPALDAICVKTARAIEAAYALPAEVGPVDKGLTIYIMGQSPGFAAYRYRRLG